MPMIWNYGYYVHGSDKPFQRGLWSHINKSHMNSIRMYCYLNNMPNSIAHRSYNILRASSSPFRGRSEIASSFGEFKQASSEVVLLGHFVRGSDQVTGCVRKWLVNVLRVRGVCYMSHRISKLYRSRTYSAKALTVSLKREILPL